MRSRLSAALAGLLLFCLWSPDVRGESIIHQSPNCCYRFLKKNITHLVRGYKLTASSCPEMAVQFTLKGGKTFCGKLQDDWVQKFVKEAEDMRRNKHSADRG
ncbi:C-C motif chemokine 7-like [Ornithorhynchus anatinus]|uniref:C-C motif chemokine 7-like n=1 Tax=Ornithorhynchus anatinus TaxID=9258 RepID=UPI0010A81703|nr:C-C motif chemokine 7-like [Ornithorhynchus anatinus]